MCLAQEHNTVATVRLEQAAPRSQVKHSTTEPLRSLEHVYKCVLNLWRLESPKRVLWQTVKTQMKCCTMRHLTRVCTVCKDLINLRRNKINIFLKIITCDLSIYIMDHSD